MNTIQSAIVLAACGAVSFILAAVLGKFIIPWLHKLKFGQTILEDGPTWHQKKQGTPTMGGILFIVGFVVAAVLGAVLAAVLKIPLSFGSLPRMVRFWAGFGLALGCGVIGFVDDFIKVVMKRNKGLTALQKILMQLTVATAYAVVMYVYSGHRVQVPFVGAVDFGIWYVPFTVFVILAMSNATNLTDGVDGLCGLTGFVAALGLLLLSGLVGNGQMYQGILAVSLAGGLSGFLLWNLHPAQVFMGDTGSLFIGGALTAIAFGIGQPFMLVPVGILYIAENLSVILQVAYFKITHGKRLFKMSPLHHHFEMCGWSENKIVLVFSGVTLLGCAAAVLLQLYA